MGTLSRKGSALRVVCVRELSRFYRTRVFTPNFMSTFHVTHTALFISAFAIYEQTKRNIKNCKKSLIKRTLYDIFRIISKDF